MKVTVSSLFGQKIHAAEVNDHRQTSLLLTSLTHATDITLIGETITLEIYLVGLGEVFYAIAVNTPETDVKSVKGP